MVVVLVYPHFPSLWYIYILCLISLMTSSYPFEMLDSWPQVSMIVVLVYPHFRSLRNILWLSPSWCPHIAACTTTCCIYYRCTDSRSIVSQLKTVGPAETFESWPSEKGSTRSETRKRNMPLVDMVAIVAEVYGAVCQPFGTRLWRRKGSVHKAKTGMYYCTLQTMQEDMMASGGKVNWWLEFLHLLATKIFLESMSCCGGGRNKWEIRLNKHKVYCKLWIGG